MICQRKSLKEFLDHHTATLLWKPKQIFISAEKVMIGQGNIRQIFLSLQTLYNLGFNTLYVQTSITDDEGGPKPEDVDNIIKTFGGIRRNSPELRQLGFYRHSTMTSRAPYMIGTTELLFHPT